MLSNLNLCSHLDNLKIPDSCKHIPTQSEALKKIQQDSTTYTVLTFSFCGSCETKNVTLSVLHDTGSLYFSHIQNYRWGFPCFNNQRQRNYLYGCWRCSAVLHKTTFRNRICKVNYTIQLPFLKKPEDRIHPWDTSHHDIQRLMQFIENL